jgi:hypothetical protein
MAAKDALQHLTRQSDDPSAGWLTPDRIRAAVAQVYDDLERVVVVPPVIQERLIAAPPIGRSSYVSVLPQITPEDGWVIIEHGMASDDVIVQASTHGTVLALGARIMGPNSVAVHTDEPVYTPIKVVIVR